MPPNAISCSAGLGVGDGQDSLSNAGNFNECMILDNAYNSKRFDSSIQVCTFISSSSSKSGKAIFKNLFTI